MLRKWLRVVFYAFLGCCLLLSLRHGQWGGHKTIDKMVVSIPLQPEGRLFWLDGSNGLLRSTLRLARVNNRNGQEPADTIISDQAVSLRWHPCYTNALFPRMLSSCFVALDRPEYSEKDQVQLTLSLPGPLTIRYGQDRTAILCSGEYVATGVVMRTRGQQRVEWMSSWRTVVTDTESHYATSGLLAVFAGVNMYRQAESHGRSDGTITETRRFRIGSAALDEYLQWLAKGGQITASDVPVLRSNPILGVEQVLHALQPSRAVVLKAKSGEHGVVDINMEPVWFEWAEKWATKDQRYLLERITDPLEVDFWGRPDVAENHGVGR